MDLINSLISELVFFKVEQKGEFVIYAAGIEGASGNGEHRYVLLFVPVYLALTDRCRAKQVEWQNMQTRIIKDGYKIPKQIWKIPREVPDVHFQLVKRDSGYSTYVPKDDTIRLEMLLLHDPRKKSIYQYYDKMSLKSSLDTFRAVINLKYGKEEEIEFIKY